MCGIFVAFNKQEKIDPSLCRRALSILSWRGPDASYSAVWEDRLFVGQTLLSITGNPLSSEGNYLRSYSGRFYLSFNGEIYNFPYLKKQFFDNSYDSVLCHDNDAEVLVNLHERLSPYEVQARLDGMFAYVIFDSKERKLYIASDVQGEKSLYIFENKKWLIVSSEIRSILAVVPNLDIDRQALRDYFRTRHLMLHNRTVYENIRNLLPGSMEVFDINSSKWLDRKALRLSDWIDPEKISKNEGKTINELVDELDSLLRGCIKEMVPQKRHYAVVVSGGVDSSLLAYYFAKNHNPNEFIAVNHIDKDIISRDLSSFEYALDRKIKTIRVDPTAYASEIFRCQKVCGGPLYSHSFIAQSIQSAYVSSEGCRVLFGGEGGDEYFGGYRDYIKQVGINSRFSPSPYSTHYTPLFNFFDDNPSLLYSLLEDMWREALIAYAFIENEYDRALMAMMYCDAAYQLPSVGLRGADLMSMIWSVETRSIYVRKPIIQFALNLPAKMRVNNNINVKPRQRTKFLLKCLFLRYFPEHLLFEKQGFAGFPNESAKFLGDISDYISPDFICIDKNSLSNGMKDRDAAWKLTNVEYFLRNTIR